MKNEFVMVPLELLNRVAIGYPQAEVLALGRSAAIVELGEFLCRATTQHRDEPVVWLVKCKQSGLVEQAEPNEKASNPEHWTDAFPVYDSPKSARSQFDYDRGFAAGTAECETLRAQLAEVHALLRELDDAWSSHDGKERFGKLMRKVETLSASAEPSAPVEHDERADFDAWTVRKGRVVGYCGWREDFAVWQARAALGHKS